MHATAAMRPASVSVARHDTATVYAYAVLTFGLLLLGYKRDKEGQK